MNPNKPAPQLAPPGAGLPKIEHFFAKIMVRWNASRTDRKTSSELFAKERDTILHLLKKTPPARLSSPVLIKRLPGLEDSSRYWSTLMTIDHLRIVNLEIAGVIADLCTGKLPERAASTAAVKPSTKVDSSVIGAFEEACRVYENTVAAQPDLKTEAVFAHPWFGPMSAGDWHFMASFHMTLHRKQIERILDGLNHT